MKKYSILLIFVSLLLSCSDDKSDMPKLELIGAFLNGGDIDYSRNLDDILPLSAGEELELSFSLDGNGIDLKSFIVENKSSNITILVLPIDKDEISEEFSDPTNRLGYKDGIRKTKAKVNLTINGAKNEEAQLSFYLNSKAPDGEGASSYLDLTTTTTPREEPIKE